MITEGVSTHMSEILLYKSSSRTKLIARSLGGSGQRDRVLGE